TGRLWYLIIFYFADKQNLLTAINIFKPCNSEVGTLRILLHGPQGAGKSSFFNSVYNVLQGRITTRALAHAVETGQSFTVKKDSPDSYFPFNFTDIAGMHSEDRGIKMDDIIKLLNGHINSGYNFNPLKPITEEDPKYNKNPTLKDRIHCLVAVFPANTVSMMDDTNLPIIRQMSDVRKEARDLVAKTKLRFSHTYLKRLVLKRPHMSESRCGKICITSPKCSRKERRRNFYSSCSIVVAAAMS
uniref:Si:dkeyp-75b4.9 n=1 Tax=Sinocyclocheilus grahami TaxID=75366 RepID=A0A672LAJ7_SINGR